MFKQTAQSACLDTKWLGIVHWRARRITRYWYVMMELGPWVVRLGRIRPKKQ